MASAEITSNLKLITSGNAPTTSNLGNGEFAFGEVDGVPKLYGNVGNKIITFVPDFGTTAGTICEGNDSRLSDTRIPKSHSSTITTYGSASQSNYGHVKQTMPLYTSRPSSVVTSTGTAFGQRSRTVMHCGSVSTVTINLNDYRCEGDYIFYNCKVRSNFPTDLSKINATNPSAHLMVLEHGHSDTTITQILFMRGAENSTSLCAWIRQCNGSTSHWSAWIKLGGSGDGLSITDGYSTMTSQTDEIVIPCDSAVKKIDVFVNNDHGDCLFTSVGIQVSGAYGVSNCNVLKAPIISFSITFFEDVTNPDNMAYFTTSGQPTEILSAGTNGDVTLSFTYDAQGSVDAQVYWRVYR